MGDEHERHATKRCFANRCAARDSGIAPSVLYGQGSAGAAGIPIPEHATRRAYGAGWECDPGYRKVGDGCAAIELPANAYLTAYSADRGWDCARGYRAEERACVAIPLPPHAYLDSGGDRWKCERGYRSVESLCAAIEVPPNGYLNAAGDDWRMRPRLSRGRRHLRCHQGAVERVSHEHFLWFRLGLRSRLPSGGHGLP